MARSVLNVKPTRIILDTDLAMGEGANIDDGFALALAHADPNLQLDMITTVHGNTDVESATILTELLATQLGIDTHDTPIFRGAATPLIRTNQQRTPSSHVLALRDAARARGQLASGAYAPIAIIEHILANPGQITLVAIGPLTNVAIALLLEPKIAVALKELVMMGGSFFGATGFRNKPGETNVFTDPEAAQAVLRSGIPQRWVGLDCTLKTRLTRKQAAELEASHSAFASFAGRAANAYIDVLAARYPGRPAPDACHIHDALAVAVVSRPEFCTFQDIAASVITGEGEARGVIIADKLEGLEPPEPNCRVAVDVDTCAFEKHFFSLINTL
ncbi:nucleoside hydrolase [Aaosphaeria arxii CBS 175.79]|uniref:Nucleoside hydrolase n=1 Tax=Aaosphaeria arxii CBS 175.79 TaxID=1450172 RepID=A0A6A5X6N4_9PLEO|nr:nucleoside hydrolase [Aaosphaeria arxii CBS 175.79]KAF2008628.1 nucleoside hydrolase [Aaosphaeria arxii CBS 175.79]